MEEHLTHIIFNSKSYNMFKMRLELAFFGKFELRIYFRYQFSVFLSQLSALKQLA